MIKPIIFTILLTSICLTGKAAPNGDSAYLETPDTLHTATGDIIGTLMLPSNTTGKVPVALIIAGSGPTDRNGNNPYAMNANLQKLAYALAANNIATLRYDKRGIGQSVWALASAGEKNLRFDNYIDDAKGWIGLLKKDTRFSQVFVIGHSEGSLIGIIASLNLADGFISIAGAGKPIDKILKVQLSNLPDSLKDPAYAIIDSLVAGKTVQNVNADLMNLFRPSVQPYMISWMKYDPQAEIKKLTIPVLLIQGTNDIQVSAEDAKLLAEADPKAQLMLIQNMNHVFRIIEGERDANIASYNNSSLPISDELVSSIAGFIKKN